MTDQNSPGNQTTDFSDSTNPEKTPTSPDLTFDSLQLQAPLLQAVNKAGFSQCTAVQAASLPHIISGRDVAAQAQTGTGKTAAFLLGSMHLLLQEDDGDSRKPNQPRMLVLAPTRELALQIQSDAEQFSEFTQLRTCIAHGGADYEKQRKKISEGVDILIGTPGRLIDYFKKRVFDLKALKIAVLDEADRMFDLGFISDIRFLLRRMPEPEKRISMLFSATLSARVMELAYEHMNNPVTVNAKGSGVTAEKVRQRLFHPATDEKISLLLGLLKSMQPAKSIVFVNTRRAAEKVEGYLKGNGHECGTLSGDVRQRKRQKILSAFTQGELPVLIATDVAARGLHIDDVSHVFNFDLPQQAEDYVHRVGRTARAGSDGEAISFACEEYSYSLPDILEYIDETIPYEPITNELLIEPLPPVELQTERPPSHNRRPNKKGGSSGRRKQTRNAAAVPTSDTTAEATAKKKKRRRRRKRSNSSVANSTPDN